MQSVDKRLRQIALNPLNYTKRHSNYREVKVEHFPYTIVYELITRKGLVHISSVRHTSRAPKQKYRRLHRPATLGNVKLEEFAKEFTVAF